jgi:lipid-binding SYLF domain-containing protein
MEGSAKLNIMFLKRAVRHLLVVTMVIMAVSLISWRLAYAASAAEIDEEAAAALNQLYEKTPAAKILAEKAKGILIFPVMRKAGFIIGAQYGEGCLIVGGKTEGYYRMSAASYGLQAGAQKFSYALFFITDSALEYLHSSKGWEIGMGPSVVIVDAGVAKTLTTTTLKSDVYAFIFGQKGLMAGLGLQGSKITQVEK